jgi:hypothetical protein
VRPSNTLQVMRWVPSDRPAISQREIDRWGELFKARATKLLELTPEPHRLARVEQTVAHGPPL